jgi:oligopeptide/dipeptide ABC transporter ATP-binding protein
MRRVRRIWTVLWLSIFGVGACGDQGVSRAEPGAWSLDPSRDLYNAPKHPYTRALLSAAPRHDPRVGAKRERIRLSGEVPGPIRPPSGCAFYSRCPHPGKDEECRKVAPVLEGKAPNHLAACFKNPMPADGA